MACCCRMSRVDTCCDLKPHILAHACSSEINKTVGQLFQGSNSNVMTIVYEEADYFAPIVNCCAGGPKTAMYTMPCDAGTNALQESLMQNERSLIALC